MPRETNGITEKRNNMTNFLYSKYYVLADNNFSPLSKNNLAKAIDLFKLLGHICFLLSKCLIRKWLKSRISEAAGRDDLDQSVFVAASLQPQILPWCQSPTFGSVFLDAKGFPARKGHWLSSKYWQIGLTDQYCFRSFVSFDCWFVGSC